MRDRSGYFNEYYAGRKLAGLCMHCANPAEPGRTRCRICADKARDRRLTKNASGICQCGRPAKSGKVSCPKCLLRSSDHRAGNQYGCPPELTEQWDLACRRGVCDICGKAAAENSRGRLHRDHSHTTPPVPRGCLCDVCNPVLGSLEKILAAKPFDISSIDNPFFAYLRARDPRYQK